MIPLVWCLIKRCLPFIVESYVGLWGCSVLDNDWMLRATRVLMPFCGREGDPEEEATLLDSLDCPPSPYSVRLPLFTFMSPR